MDILFVDYKDDKNFRHPQSDNPFFPAVFFETWIRVGPRQQVRL